MRRPVPESLVLRLAVRLLLALVLCLNGIFAPVAMAQHGAMAAEQKEAAMPCHEMAADMSMDHHDGAVHQGGAPADKHHPDCCKHGQCLCSCVAASLPALPVVVQAAAPSRLALPAIRDIAAFRYAVALRPPIA